MSVEHRHTDTPARVCVQQTNADGTTRDEPRSPERSNRTTRVRDPLPARIERTQLRLRVTALERELEASETERQEIIDRYEFVLQNRESDSVESTTDDDGLVRRIRRLFE
ncbi:hypothetical protein [Halostagnicola bangensis]